MRRLCGFCIGRDVMSACCKYGYLQAIEPPCISGAPYQHKNIVTYNSHYLNITVSNQKFWSKFTVKETVHAS